MAMAKRDQPSFLEAFASPSLGKNDVLDRVVATVKWYRFEKLLSQLRPEGPGRPPHEPLMMFKALLLAQLYDLSDEGLEEALNDRVSFRRFVGLTLEKAAPDHTSLCRFRNRLADDGMGQRLFAEFDRQLEKQNLVLKRGTMLDATLVQAATGKPPRGDEDEALDADAAFAKRDGKPGSVYGYKAHIGVDQGTRLIRSAVVTAANVNETTVADGLVRGDEEAVYADKAYQSRARRASLKARGIKARIMHKSWGGGPPLSHWQRRHNKLIAPIRASVETVFAVLKRRMGYRRARYVGLRKNLNHFLLLAIAYNMRRASALAA
jgi:IS5 family transposase